MPPGQSRWFLAAGALCMGLNAASVHAQMLCWNDCDCGRIGYCQKPTGNDNELGVCQPPWLMEAEPGEELGPQGIICIEVYDPVCGCDGRTYSNSCYARAAGTGVAHGGPCGSGDAPCSGAFGCNGSRYCRASPGTCEVQGFCDERPGVCPYDWDPVCGCDNVTYPNACAAEAAGMNVAYLGESDQACAADAECGAGNYCQRATGDCSGQGTCASRGGPVICPTVWLPVCGCNGATYGNACEAMRAGVNVAHEGECMAACSDNSGCAAGEFCHKPAGDCGGTGACEPLPELCFLDMAPVCGCDGVTYTNACEAMRAGVSVAHEGGCGGVCIDDSGCPAGQFCHKPAGDCGGGSGVCEPRPDACCEAYEPVCGCNRVTYANTCQAALFGVNVLYEGACWSRFDLDHDGDVDEYDARHLFECLGGSGLAQNDAECQGAKLDDDDDVDQSDFGLLQLCMSGAGQAMHPACID